MPLKKINFSLAPINDNPVQSSGATLVNGFSHKNGFPTIKFSIPAQDVLLDTNNLHLTGQLVVLDKDGNLLSTAQADLANYDVNNGSQTIQSQNCINLSNWNGIHSVVDKVVVQSKKSQTEIQTLTHYSPYNALKSAHSNNKEDYKQVPLVRDLATGIDSGFTNRHLINSAVVAESRISSLDDKFLGTPFSMKLDVATLDSGAIHLGNGFAGGLLLTLHLAPDSNVFHTRFRSINAATASADTTGCSYILKNLKLEGKYAVPTPQDLSSYNPVLQLNTRTNLLNDLVSSENSNVFTPQLQLVKGVVNTFMDDDQQNNFKQNSHCFRYPVGLVSTQNAKNNIQYPQQYSVEVQPNTESSDVNGNAMNPNENTDFPASCMGDAEVRQNFQRALFGGRAPTHTSATYDLTNQSLKADYDASTATTNTLQTGDNTIPDVLGLGTDYSNNLGQVQNFVNQDYELKVSSGVGSGRANLPSTRRTKIEVQESYLRHFAQLDLRTLQKVQ